MSEPAITDEATIAQRDAALDALAALARYVRRVGGYMKPEDQQMLWIAQSLLVESGRKI